MSDNDDLLGDDLGDQNLGDYTLGNDEEDQLLADDYESVSHNVPVSVGPSYGEVSQEYSAPIEYNQPTQYHMPESECVVPNIAVEVPNPRPPTYAPYEPAYEAECVVPPAMPAVPLESPQIVPTDISASIANGDNARERFISERPPGAQRTPQIRDIPDTLDKVLVPRGGFAPRPRTSWHNPHYHPRNSHPYRRNNMQRGNFNQRPSFPPPQIRHSPPQIRPDFRPERPGFRPEGPEFRPERPEFRPERPEFGPERPEFRPEFRPNRPEFRPERPEFRPEGPEFGPERPEFRPDRPEFGPDRPEFRPDNRPDFHPDRPGFRPENRPDFNPDRPEFRPDLPLRSMPDERPQDMPFRPPMDVRPFNPNFPPRFPNQFRPNLDEPRFKDPGFRPRFDNQFQFRPGFNPRFGPPIREIASNSNHIPQVTIRQPLPNPVLPKPGQREPEVRMLPVQLPANLPGGLQGKKVLINPHFKGNFQSTEGLTIPAYIPTRIQKSPPPPVGPTIENKFGPVKDIDDAAERFIAEQRNALARAATRNIRYIENTTIEIDNELSRRTEEDDLLRRQEEFINANRAGLRRRMRTPTPPRRSPSPRRARPESRLTGDEDSDYKRRVREQESLRERVLRAKEVRRRKNAVALQKQIQDKDRERLANSDNKPKPDTSNIETARADTTRKSPEKPVKPDDKEKLDDDAGKLDDKVGKLDDKVGKKDDKAGKFDVKRDRSPVRKEEAVVNSTCENLTPPRPKQTSPERALTPPLPRPAKSDSDDDLDLILDDIDDILSDDDDTGRFKERNKKPEPPKSKPQVDLRSKLPPKSQEKKPPRQKIVFSEPKEERKKEKSPPKKSAVTSTKADVEKEDKSIKTKQKTDSAALKLSKPRIIFDNKLAEKETEAKPFTNRRVILKRKATDKSVFSRIEVKTDPTKPNPGIFSRAVRTAIGNDKRIVIQKEKEDTQVEYESESDIDEDKLLEEEIGYIAVVKNLPHGMTDTRLKTLAGSCQSLTLDKEERTAKITFKTTIAAEGFKKKFHNKMVAASRLSVSLL